MTPRAGEMDSPARDPLRLRPMPPARHHFVITTLRTIVRPGTRSLTK